MVAIIIVVVVVVVVSATLRNWFNVTKQRASVGKAGNINNWWSICVRG
jgi:uncharacterized membrane protein affecting hemolysin expression